MRFAQFTLLLAALLLARQPLMAQIPNLTLTAVDNTLNPDRSQIFLINGAAGTWVHVMMFCYLPDHHRDLTKYPWMALNETDLSTNDVHYLAGQEKLIVDQNFLFDLINRAGTLATEKQVVRNVWQNLPGSSAGSSSIYWEARPQSWIGNSLSADVRSSWSQRREYVDVAGQPGEPFNLQKCAIWAMRKQAGDQAIGDQAWEDDAKTWLLQGDLMIAFQAVSLVDNTSVLYPQNPTGEAAGLEGLPTPPKVQISPKVVLPLVKGGLGFTYDPNLPAYAGQIFEAREDGFLTVPMRGIVPPLELTIKVGNRTFVLDGGLAPELGHAIFELPSIVSAGQTIECIDLKNAFYGPLPISSAIPLLTVMAPVGAVAGP